jgi:glutamate synthase (NADPH/NADH)
MVSDAGKGNWAEVFPEPPQRSLYASQELEKDACGVGFIAHIKGSPSHSIVSQAKHILCNMTHRGAVGADSRDGDGAGVMTSIPHAFFAKEVKDRHGVELPPPGQYAVGNIFMNPDPTIFRESQTKFVELAHQLGLAILCWRTVKKNNAILGPVALSKEPLIVQPFMTTATNISSASSAMAGGPFDEIGFERQLYLLRKKATHAISARKWFYICSLSSKNIVYKGQLSPVQVYSYFDDLTRPEFVSHFCLVHSRFSTNTFPSWDRAQPMRWCAHNGTYYL